MRRAGFCRLEVSPPVLEQELLQPGSLRAGAAQEVLGALADAFLEYAKTSVYLVTGVSF
jgi:hypothetical protein